MTEYWSGSITFTGLGSGTDFETIIEATMNVESYRLNRMQAWGEQWKSKLELVQGVSSELALYKTQLEAMNTTNEFLTKTASSTNSTVVTATAGADAQEGTHSIEVLQKAQNDIWSTTTGWEKPGSVITDTDTVFTVEYGGKTLEINVPSGTTLEGFARLVNNDADMGKAVRANIIDDGDELHLQLRGMDQGADNTVTIVDHGANGIPGLSPDDFQHNQVAQNAKIKVDGYPKGEDDWIERDSNTFSDVIEGLTITLHGVSYGAAVDLNVTTDMDAVIANIENFLERTNAIRDAITALDKDMNLTDSEGNAVNTTGYQVRGNYGMNIIKQTLQDILASKGLGFAYYDPENNSGDPYASFVSIGITTDADENSQTFGHLVIDYEELEKALTQDPDAVARLFAAENDGVSYDTTVSYGSSVKSITKPGEYEVAYTVQDGKIVSATIGGEKANIDGWSITGVAGDGAGLSVTANMHVDGEYTGTVYLRQGKINQTLNALSSFTSSENGTLKIIEDSYQTIIDNNEKAMDSEKARLELKRQNLVERYAALESLLGQYDGISTSLESMINDLE
ncbi:flagellar hook protein [Oceanidesulfovibrio indonesiensis]|uniref:Flagellar hook-associated protein 2 n=1 Tax=Oceanidesulfovibrio indonesiensis TaxID=54767 RepID=A0A7M3MC65_9BACT|nr:flagellar filament capping protein FliD [Oceanidesulfovibrio indonesiensis]TVM15940.1 flagellar hook protein [Oceanidesulfovibrio indonesiensis]